MLDKVKEKQVPMVVNVGVSVRQAFRLKALGEGKASAEKLREMVHNYIKKG